LHFAIDFGRKGIAEFCIDRAKDINVKDKFGDTALLHAVKQNSEALVVKLLKRIDIDVNAKNRADMTALFVALVKGFTAIALQLIHAEPDFLTKNKLGVTALSLSIGQLEENCLCCLLVLLRFSRLLSFHDDSGSSLTHPPILPSVFLSILGPDLTLTLTLTPPSTLTKPPQTPD
jgi:hypothetical protein